MVFQCRHQRRFQTSRKAWQAQQSWQMLKGMYRLQLAMQISKSQGSKNVQQDNYTASQKTAPFHFCQTVFLYENNYRRTETAVNLEQNDIKIITLSRRVLRRQHTCTCHNNVTETQYMKVTYNDLWVRSRTLTCLAQQEYLPKLGLHSKHWELEESDNVEIGA